MVEIYIKSYFDKFFLNHLKMNFSCLQYKVIDLIVLIFALFHIQDERKTDLGSYVRKIYSITIDVRRRI